MTTKSLHNTNFHGTYMWTYLITSAMFTQSAGIQHRHTTGIHRQQAYNRQPFNTCLHILHTAYCHTAITHGIPGGTLRGEEKTARGDQRGAISEGKPARGELRGWEARAKGERRGARSAVSGNSEARKADIDCPARYLRYVWRTILIMHMTSQPLQPPQWMAAVVVCSNEHHSLVSEL